jgi:O-antigen/teichoic acid export membrane protein
MATTSTQPRPHRPSDRLRGPITSQRTARVPGRIARNFLLLSGAEIACRATSVAVTLTLAKCLGTAGYGRIEFAFNVVFWLVLLVRDGFEVIASRELARHPRLVRPLVNHLLAVKVLLASGLYAGLMIVGLTTFKGDTERTLLALYGLMLFTTAVGIDYVFRGLEKVGVVAISLCLRTAIYAAGVWFWVGDASRIVWVPAWLAVGEAVGIGFVWGHYVRSNGWPRPMPGRRFLGVFLRRGKPVLLIQLAQTMLSSVDLMVVGLLCTWGEIGQFGAPHRMVTAVLTFGLIFQQVVFPTLARSWRETPDDGRRSLDALVRVLALGLLPIAVGTTILAKPLVRLLFPAEYASAATLLAVGIWRAPLLTLAFLYQTTLIALNREAVWVRLLVTAAIVSGPLVGILLAAFGLPGAASAVGLIALGLVAAGHACLAREGRAPAWHHHLARPIAASIVMVAACLALKDVHVLLAVAGGAVAYGVSLAALGGLDRAEITALLRRA